MITQELAYDYDRAASTCAGCGGAATSTSLEHGAGCPEMARIIAGAVSAERERIRAGAEALRVTLFRPGNGPAHGQWVDVVAWDALVKVIGGGS